MKNKKSESKISFDGKQLLTRIPKDIENQTKLEKGDLFLWNIDGKHKINLERIKQCFVCRKFAHGLHKHHLDKDHKNNNKKNIVLICMDCHKLIHSKREIPNNFLPEQRNLIKKFKYLSYNGLKKRGED